MTVFFFQRYNYISVGPANIPPPQKWFLLNSAHLSMSSSSPLFNVLKVCQAAGDRQQLVQEIN